MNEFIESVFLDMKALSILDYIIILMTTFTILKTDKYINILKGTNEKFMKIKGYSFKVPYNKKTKRQKKVMWGNYIIIVVFLIFGFIEWGNTISNYIFSLWCISNIINILIEEFLLKRFLFISRYEFIIDGSTIRYTSSQEPPELAIEIKEKEDFVAVSINNNRIAVAKVEESQKKAMNEINKKMKNKKDKRK